MFTGKFKIAVSISAIIIVLGVICAVAFSGLNLGIDFAGGSLTTIDIKTEYNVDVIREVLARNDAADSPVVKTGTDFMEAEIRMRDLGDEEIQATVTERILSGIRETYPEAELVSVNRVGGVTSAEIVRNALLAIVIACLLMLVYIWIRFELYSGIAAVIALVHDILIMISFVAIIQLQVNSAFIAVCLTILGYSLNNTIVVFDRIRDKRKVLKAKQITNNEMADISIGETLSRNINTSVTTLIMIVCLYIFGVESIKEFSLPIIVGLVAAVYSSIFIVAPLWAKLMDRAELKKKAAARGKNAGDKPVTKAGAKTGSKTITNVSRKTSPKTAPKSDSQAGAKPKKKTAKAKA